MNEFSNYLNTIGEVGQVASLVQTIARVDGLPGARLGEMVILQSGQIGQVISLVVNSVEVLVLSSRPAQVGTRVARTGTNLEILVGEAILGCTVDALGRVLGKPLPPGVKLERQTLDKTPAGISGRRKISKFMETGVILSDTLVPLGRGQRELVLGDRKTGKTHMLLKAMLAEAKLGNVCVYAAVGKKKAEIKRVEEYFGAMGVEKNVIMVAASSQDSAGEIFLSPYTAMAIAEYFCGRGRDVLVVLDDMTTHAKFYREMALLGRRFPGRDSYPGDIFYIHSRLLERAGNFLVAGREVAITCLPVAETVQGDMTGYIQTNLMSMTDGHIYFDSDLYFTGRRPAINAFASVTRVGHQTQTRLQQEVSRATLNLLSDYDKTQSFVRFGAELGDTSRQILIMGEKMLKFFDQPANVVVPIPVQLVLWGLLWEGLWDGQNMERLVVAYEADPVFRTTVNNLVAGSQSLSALVSALRTQSAKLLNVVA